MRNLLEYPITKEEMLAALEKVIQKESEEALKSELIGDVTVVALVEARKIVEDKPGIIKEFTESEMRALDEIGKKQDLSRIATLRQAVRLYQLYHTHGGTVNMPEMPPKMSPPYSEVTARPVGPQSADFCTGTGGEHGAAPLKETEKETIRRYLVEAMGSDVCEDSGLAELVAVLVSQRDNARNGEEEWKKRAESK